MHVINFGLNHKSASLTLREHFAFYKDELPVALSLLAQSKGIDECLILSTCNRTEIYAVTRNVAEALNSLRQFFLKAKEIDTGSYKENFYLHIDAQCLYHLFSVAAGLDSLVVGETQILGQLKEAYRVAQENFSVAQVLHAVFQRAFFVAKKIRSSFALGKGQVSIGSAAVALVKEKLNTLREKQVFIIGTGEISCLILKYLQKEKAAVLIANRTYRKAEELANAFGGTAVAFNRIFDYLGNTDILIASTSAPHYLLTEENAIPALSRRNRPIIVLDLAVPRNIAPGLGKMKGVYLYNTDDLAGITEVNLAKRQNGLMLCQETIQKESEKCSAQIFIQDKELANA